MKNFYRSKIVAKRQMTLPQEMLDQLGLKIGDELEFTVEAGRIGEVRPFRPTPLNPFTPAVEQTLARREKEIAEGRGGSEFEEPDAERETPEEDYMAAADILQEEIQRASESLRVAFEQMQRGEALLSDARKKVLQASVKGYAETSRAAR